MAQTKRLPDAELEVMQTIWTLTPPVTAAEVQQHASSDWKMTSVLTFLSRLTERAFCPVPRRDGRTCIRRSSRRRPTASAKASALSGVCAAAR